MYTDAIVSLFLVAVLGYVFYGPWQNVCTDWARQVVFESRDGIFDLARSGKLDFNSDIYKAIRSSLEVLIRFSHELTLPYLIFHIICMNGGRPNTASSLHASVDEIEVQETRSNVKRLVRNAQRAIFIMIAAKSIILLPILIFFLSKQIRQRFKPQMQTLAEMIQKDAEISGC